jgi:hypothetical protein
MSLKPMEIPPVPAETARVAHAALPKGTSFLRFRDELGVIYRDEMFADLFSKRGQPATAPWRLALVSVFQFVEGLSDRQAAETLPRRGMGSDGPRRRCETLMLQHSDLPVASGKTVTKRTVIPVPVGMSARSSP